MACIWNVCLFYIFLILNCDRLKSFRCWHSNKTTIYQCIRARLPSTTARKRIGRKLEWMTTIKKGRAGGWKIHFFFWKPSNQQKQTIEPISYNFLFEWHTFKYAKLSNALVHGFFSLFSLLFAFFSTISSARYDVWVSFSLVVSYRALRFGIHFLLCDGGVNLINDNIHKIAVGLSFPSFGFMNGKWQWLCYDWIDMVSVLS